MLPLQSQLHLERARGMGDAAGAIDEYMRAIEEAVRELKAAQPAPRRRR